MKTKYKITIAKALYKAIRAGRLLAGRGNEVIATRRGIRFNLDLSEGIDLAIYLQGQFEPTLAATYAHVVRPGHTVLDIGANVGAHTLSLARLVGDKGTVLAFEPTAYAFAKLQRNLALNPTLARRVVAQQCFLSSKDHAAAPGAIFSSWPLARRDDLHAVHLGAAMPTEGAQTRRLDSLLTDRQIKRVDFVKMDVDGYECDVLAGSTAMLRRDRPTFILEVVPYVLAEQGRSVAELLSYFLDLDYRFYQIGTLEPLPSEPERLEVLASQGTLMNIVARIE